MESVSSNPERLIKGYLEQLGISRKEECLTVEISHPRTRIQGVIIIRAHIRPLQYVAFLGIPYALPPVGKERFQPPKELPQVPDDQPTPLFLAHERSHPRTQRDENDEIIGSEDCLYLNVYTPRKPRDIPELLPVLVYIHGGGFTTGGLYDEADPENLIRENLVVVTINYRLSIFELLNMSTENCLGNAGMKDQVMALRWVRHNIEKFKGNPENVTICGHGAGGSCVNLHMLSPLSKGLFHKAIVMAGGVYCPWGYGGRSKHVVQLFKNAVFKSKESRQVTVDILKEKTTLDLVELGEETITTQPGKIAALFRPTVECVKEGAFLPDTVEKLMEVATPVPTMAGITKQEGYLFFLAHASEVVEVMKGEIKFVELVKNVIRQNFSWKDPTAFDRHFEFFKNTYFPEEWMFEDEEYKPMTEEEKQRKDDEKERKEEERKHRLATLLTDIYFRRFYDNFKIGNLLDEGSHSFYVYEFDYFAGQPVDEMLTWEDDHHVHEPVIKPRANEHTDDYNYLFSPIYVDEMLNRIAEEDRTRVGLQIERVQMNMSSLWSSFCRTGHPVTRVPCDAHVKWKPHTEQDPHYLRIGEGITLKKGLLNEGRWSALNAICQLEPTIPSLPVSPQTPKIKFADLQQSPPQPELGSSSTQAAETECEVVQISRPKPDSSTSPTPDTDYEIFQLSQPEPGQSTSHISVEDVEFESTKF